MNVTLLFNETLNATVSELIAPTCREVNQINASLRCNFVRTTDDCKNSIGHLDYTSYMYCSFGPEGAPIAVGLSVLWLLLLFIGLGITSNDFLCPALFVISKTLRMSQNVAGVTLLAFGNGSPDIFSAIAGINQGKTDLVIGGLVGGGIFVTTIVAGSIFLIKSFTVMKRPFIRDVVFYFGAAGWVYYLFYTGSIYIYHATGLVVLYLMYIVVVVVSRFVHQRSKVSNKEQEASTSTVQNEEVIISFSGARREDNPEAAGVVLTSFFFLNDYWDEAHPSQPISPSEQGIFVVSPPPDIPGRRPTCGSINIGLDPPEITSSEMSLVSTKRRETIIPKESGADLVKEFLYQICPINIRGWGDLIWWQRILEICKSPVMLLLTLTTPVMDVTKPKHNWCRYLNVVHCVTGPMFILLASGQALTQVGGKVPVIAIVFIVSALLAAIVYFLTTNEQPPRFHCAFSYLGFIVAVLWIYCIANEIVVLLQAVGIVFNLSDTIIGLTILAWGNCLLDFLSNLAVARKGFPRMGIAACFGAPFLTLLLGIGVPCLIRLLGNAGGMGSLQLTYTKLTTILFVTLATSLISTLATMTVLRFQVKRFYGGCLIALYLTFLVTSVLTELKILFA